jgi:hypothetical protein
MAVLLVAGSLTVGTGLPAVAQDPDAIVFEYRSTDSSQAGTITIREIAEDFVGFAADDPPGPGQRYVALAVRFAASPDMPFDSEPSGMRLQDVAGFMYAPAAITLAAGAPSRVLEDQRLQPGDRATGLVAFEVPRDAVIDEILYVPTPPNDPAITYRPQTGATLLTILDTVPGEVPPLGTPVTDQSPDGALAGTVTVRGITDPFTPSVPIASPLSSGLAASPPASAAIGDDKRFVLVDVVFEAAPDRGFQSAPWFIVLHDTEGNQWGYQEDTVLPPDAVLGELLNRTLGPEDRSSGVVAFVVPRSAVIDQVVYEPPYARRRIPLADVRPAESTLTR